MEIVFQAHHAPISPTMRLRVERAIRKLGARMPHAVDAIVLFEQDGPTKRVEIVLHAPRQRKLVAEGEARFFGVALSQAVSRLQRQTAKQKRTPKRRAAAGRRA